jgi:CheY-like chemotaxis protein
LVQRLHILLAEDDDNDVRITRRAIAKAGLEAELTVVRDGQEAVAFLFRRGPHVDAPRPDLVLLDINLPKLDGMEVLTAIKQNREIRALPVIMLTTSTRQEDAQTAYTMGANTFIAKPIRFARFVEVIREIGMFWGQVADRP